jgi:hypothetical protein
MPWGERVGVRGSAELTMNQFLIKYIVWVTNEERMEGATYGRPDINR